MHSNGPDLSALLILWSVGYLTLKKMYVIKPYVSFLRYKLIQYSYKWRFFVNVFVIVDWSVWRNQTNEEHDANFTTDQFGHLKRVLVRNCSAGSDRSLSHIILGLACCLIVYLLIIWFTFSRINLCTIIHLEWRVIVFLIYLFIYLFI